MTYSTTRFGVYEISKQWIAGESGDITALPFYQKVALSGVSGAIGGFIGTPADMILIRMQNDIKLPLDQRRNYKNVIDGLIKVWKQEGPCSLLNGATAHMSRSVLMTIGQLAFYDQIKYILLKKLPSLFQDDLHTHFTASLLAGAAATAITQPVDVLKTRIMNAAPGETKSIAGCIKIVIKNHGLPGFYKGFVPRFARLTPHTILTFVFLEQLRLRFGYIRSA
jgi:dicarboxylate transporter 10